MIVNELAQWAVLVFLAVFVLGLTRQLGRFLGDPATAYSPSVSPPQPGAALPSALLAEPQRSALSQNIQASAAGFGIVAVVNEGCSGCDVLLDAVERGERPDGVPLVAVSWVSGGDHHARLCDAFDLVVRDPLGESSRAAGIAATPFALAVDASLTVLLAQHGGNLSSIAEAARAVARPTRGHNGAPAVPVVHRSPNRGR